MDHYCTHSIAPTTVIYFVHFRIMVLAHDDDKDMTSKNRNMFSYLYFCVGLTKNLISFGLDPTGSNPVRTLINAIFTNVFNPDNLVFLWNLKPRAQGMSLWQNNVTNRKFITSKCLIYVYRGLNTFAKTCNIGIRLWSLVEQYSVLVYADDPGIRNEL